MLSTLLSSYLVLTRFRLCRLLHRLLSSQHPVDDCGGLYRAVEPIVGHDSRRRVRLFPPLFQGFELILLSSTPRIVWIMHLALGFPVYRYTRGTQYGEQLESGSFLLELPPHPSSPSSTRRRSLHRRLSLMDSSSESDDGPLERPIVEQAVGKTRRTRRSSKKRSVRPVSSRRRRRGRVEQVDEGGSSQEELVEAGEQEGEGEEQEKEREECRQQRRRTRQ